MAFEAEYTSDNLAVVTVQVAEADGAPTDADFANTPPDGTVVLAHNGTRWCLYAKADGTWTLMSPAT